MVNEGVIHVTQGIETEDGYVKGIAALDVETGDILWRYHTDIGLGRRAAVADGVLYVGSTSDYYLYAITGPDENLDCWPQ